MSQFDHLRTARLTSLVQAYVQSLQLRNYSPRTVDNNRFGLDKFVRWCDDREVSNPGDITEDVISSYRRYLFHHVSETTGKSLHVNSQANQLITVRSFCRWLVRHDVITRDPTLKLEIPQSGKRRLADVMTLEEVGALLSAPDVKADLGVRDRAILETFFSTAIRASELLNLEPTDVCVERGLIHIRTGRATRTVSSR